ncbi:MAG: hypothetical protein ACQESG_02530 [Nanobdellota archaeon]
MYNTYLHQRSDTLYTHRSSLGHVLGTLSTNRYPSLDSFMGSLSDDMKTGGPILPVQQGPFVELKPEPLDPYSILRQVFPSDYVLEAPETINAQRIINSPGSLWPKVPILSEEVISAQLDVARGIEHELLLFSCPRVTDSSQSSLTRIHEALEDYGYRPLLEYNRAEGPYTLHVHTR